MNLFDPNKNYRTIFLQGIGLLVSFLLVIWVTRKFDFQQVLHVIKTAHQIFLIPAFLILLLNYSVRSKRWGVIFDNSKQVQLKNLFPAMMIGYLANNIFPARAGEFVRAHALGNRCNISKSTVLATIFVERLVDLLVLMLLLVIFSAIYPLPGWLKHAGLIVGLISVIILVFLFTASYRGDWILEKLIRRFTFLPQKILKRIEDLCIKFFNGLKGLRDKRRFLSFTAYTIFIWLLESVMVWLVSQAFSLQLSIAQALFIIVAVGLGTMIPSSPGYIGTYEFFAINALATIGIHDSSALGFTLTLHILLLLGTSIIGGLCLAGSGQTVFKFRSGPREYLMDEGRVDSA